jgi:hypothetical protein
MPTSPSRAALAGAFLAVLVPTLVLTFPSFAAGPPSAQQSVFTAPPFCVSPKNVFVPPSCRCRFEGTLRDAQGVPIPNFPASQVVLDFSACGRPSTRPLDRIPADQNSNANGLVFWETALTFGGADPCQVLVRVQNAIFATIPGHQGLPDLEIDGGVRSPDENGDGLVALPDLATFQQEFVNAGPRFDYRGDWAMPCDGRTTLGDLAWFQCHFVTPGQ